MSETRTTQAKNTLAAVRLYRLGLLGLVCLLGLLGLFQICRQPEVGTRTLIMVLSPHAPAGYALFDGEELRKGKIAKLEPNSLDLEEHVEILDFRHSLLLLDRTKIGKHEMRWEEKVGDRLGKVGVKKITKVSVATFQEFDFEDLFKNRTNWLGEWSA